MDAENFALVDDAIGQQVLADILLIDFLATDGAVGPRLDPVLQTVEAKSMTTSGRHVPAEETSRLMKHL